MVMQFIFKKVALNIYVAMVNNLQATSDMHLAVFLV